MWNRSLDNHACEARVISGLLLSALTLMLTACGTKPALRPASPDDLATLRALAADPAHDGGFRATGRARVRNADEEIEFFMETLKRIRVTLTDDDLAALRKSLFAQQKK